jgi:uncharacterized DUF497 family protein
VSTIVFRDFEWDDAKARTNLKKHGVSFEEAASVFLDLDYLLLRDRSAPDRFVALGYSDLARILFVVHCERAERLRIISARKATRQESASHERSKRP